MRLFCPGLTLAHSLLIFIDKRGNLLKKHNISQFVIRYVRLFILFYIFASVLEQSIGIYEQKDCF